MSYDSEKDTLLHIKRVAQFLLYFANELIDRANKHDASKLVEPEKGTFDKFTHKLKNSTYGSDEYYEFLNGMQKALNHHYENNSHHPEHYSNGLDDFNLMDLVEMIADWRAASERHDDGNIYKSLEINKKRFGISDQLYGILKNTVDGYLGKTL